MLALCALLSAAAPESALVVMGERVTATQLAEAEAGIRAAWRGPLQPRETTDSLLRSAAARGLTCDLAQVDCLVQAGVLLAVPQVIVATVDRRASPPELVVVVVGTESGRAERRARGPLRSPDLVVARLATPEARATRLVIRGASASVGVDGGPMTAARFERTDLGAGPHTLQIRAPGFEPRTRAVEVLLGEETRVDANDGLVPIAALAAAGAPVVAGAPREGQGAPGDAGLQLPLAIGGGVGALAGAGLVAAGAVLFFERETAFAALLAVEAQADAATVRDEQFRASITAARARFDGAESGWAGIGQPLVVGGAALVGVGVGVAAGALVAGE